jgi:phosphate transport system substrate-binding protein
MFGLSSFRFVTFSFALLCVGAVTAATAPAIDDNVISWAGCGITKKAFMAELAKGYEAKTGIKMDLHGGGATRGIRDTAGHKMDMGGSCRMTLPELDSSELYVTLHPVAWDALAVILHPSNPVENLSSEQIRDIYLGKITNWKELGGNDAPLELYVREGKISGVGYAIRQYLFKNGSVEFKTENVVKSSGPLEKAVEQNPNAMGITGVSSARKRNVKIGSIDGRSPSYDNVKNGSYGLYRPLYLVTNPGPGRKVRDFIKFANSEDGRQIMRDNGTVPYRDALNLMSKLLIYGFGVK